jgi:hypothetical protein
MRIKKAMVTTRLQANKEFIKGGLVKRKRWIAGWNS